MPVQAQCVSVGLPTLTPCLGVCLSPMVPEPFTFTAKKTSSLCFKRFCFFFLSLPSIASCQVCFLKNKKFFSFRRQRFDCARRRISFSSANVNSDNGCSMKDSRRLKYPLAAASNKATILNIIRLCNRSNKRGSAIKSL